MNRKRETAKCALFFAFEAMILLLSSGLTGCHNDTEADNISPRDAAIEKARAWEKRRYENVLTQKNIPVYGYRIINEFDHEET